jgi:hypothetical protein
MTQSNTVVLMEFYSIIKEMRNNLDESWNIMSSERSQLEKPTYYMILCIWDSTVGSTWRQKAEQWLLRGGIENQEHYN